jgi:hypothetical protein
MKLNLDILFCLVTFSLLLNHSNAQSAKDSGLLMPVRTFYYPKNVWEPSKENVEYLNTSFMQDLRILKDSNYVVIIEGHTDDTGNPRNNMELSRKRVQFIMDILLKHGVDSARIKSTYFGATKPETRNIAISKKKADTRYANRRVLIKVQKQK